jgi:hypothetical protein
MTSYYICATVTMTQVVWREHLWNISILQRVHLSNLVLLRATYFRQYLSLTGCIFCFIQMCERAKVVRTFCGCAAVTCTHGNRRGDRAWRKGRAVPLAKPPDILIVHNSTKKFLIDQSVCK